MAEQKNVEQGKTELKKRPKSSKIGSMGGAFKQNEGGSKELERPTSG